MPGRNFSTEEAIVKRRKAILFGFAIVAMIASGSSSANGHHHSHGSSVGVIFSIPLTAPYYYPPSYSYPSYFYPGPPVVLAPAAPTIYIEQENQARSTSYWYYCGNPQGYYPYVRNCTENWQPVAPQSPPPQ